MCKCLAKLVEEKSYSMANVKASPSRVMHTKHANEAWELSGFPDGFCETTRLGSRLSGGGWVG